jgi:hypothetical protein
MEVNPQGSSTEFYNNTLNSTVSRAGIKVNYEKWDSNIESSIEPCVIFLSLISKL